MAKTNLRMGLLVALASVRYSQEVFYLHIDRNDDSALLVHLDSNMRTDVSLDVNALLSAVKEKKSGLTALEVDTHVYVVSDDNRKKVQKKLGLNGKKLPLGAVAFPGEQYIILDARGDNFKDRDKFLGKIVSHLPVDLPHDVKANYVFSDGAISHKKESFILFPALDNDDLSLVWAVTHDKRGTKWAHVFADFHAAFDKLRSLAEAPAVAKAA